MHLFKRNRIEESSSILLAISILNISKNVVITKEEKEIELKQWIEEK